MIVKSKCLCRSSSHVYEEVIIEELPEDHSIAPIVKTNGKAVTIPYAIFPMDARPEQRDSLLFVYPLLPTRHAQYAIGEFSSEGILYKTHVFELDFEKAKWRSRLNYRTNPEECSRIKNCPRGKWPMGNARIILDAAAISPKHIVLRGAMRIPANQPDLPQVFCIDQQLNRIDSDFTILKPYSFNSSSTAHESYRDVLFSVRIPLDEDLVMRDDIFLVLHSDAPSLQATAYRRLSVEECKNMLEKSNRQYLDIDCNAEYQQWRNLTRITPESLIRQREHSFPYMPKFSIVVPLYKTPKRFFFDMVESVTSQSYPNWELILVNASPEDAELRESAQVAMGNDERITSIELEENLGISLNTNAGVRIARGDFVCFFDHDDLLEPDLLFEYVKAINERPETDILYCDEDKLTPDGFYVDPKFKPDFSIDYLCDNNYICHLLTIRTSLLRSLPENAKEYDGAQDHNMVLRAAEHARHVKHVRRILYHWRMSETSTSGNPDNKPYATIAGIKAVQAHFDRLNIPVTVTKSRRNFTYAIRYHAPADVPLVSVIIPTRGDLALVKQALASLDSATDYPRIEVLIVAQQDRSASQILTSASWDAYKFPVSVIYNKSSFSPQVAFNAGAKAAEGEFLLFMHDDVMAEAPFNLAHLVGAASRSDIGAVGPRLFYPDNCLQHAGYRLEKDGNIRDYFKKIPRNRWGLLCLADSQRNVTAVSSACMMISSKNFHAVNGFDSHLSWEYGDVDLCLRLKELNHITLFTPEANAMHFENPYFDYPTDELKEAAELCINKSLFLKKWSKEIDDHDPFFNDGLDHVMGTSFESCLI